MIDTLIDGPLDIVGDVHGEIEALRLLLSHLGYDAGGMHPDGRRLIFVGDLVDRGPDSPSVIELVMQLVDAGSAQCILGNHELNLLRGKRKDGNDWFTNPDEPGEFPFKPALGEQKGDFIDFLTSLPLALERGDLRIVHACWHGDSVQQLKSLDASASALEAYRQFESYLEPTYVPTGMTVEGLEQLLKYKDDPPLLMQELAIHDAKYQMGNPVRVLTSGEEAPASEPFWAGGKWRMVARQKWWDHYDEEPAVIVGHYWRRYSEVPVKFGDKYGPDLFEGIEPHHWMGKRKNVYCVDFSVGLRHRARANNSPEHIFKLAALRWPEQVVVHDDGLIHRLH